MTSNCMMEGLGKALANSRKEAEEEEEEQTCWKCAAFVSAVFVKSHAFPSCVESLFGFLLFM